MNTEKKALCSEKPSRWSSVVGMIVLGVICLYCIWQDYLYATIEAAIVPTRRIWLVGVGALLVVLTETCHAILTSHKATENALWRDVVWKWEKLGTTALAAHCFAAAIAHHVQRHAEVLETLRTHEILLIYEATSIFYGFFLAWLIHRVRLWRDDK